MKVNIVNSLVAAAFSALIAYGCYALCDYKEVQLLVTIAAFVQFVVLGMRATYGYDIPHRDGVLLERALPALRLPFMGGSYTEF